MDARGVVFIYTGGYVRQWYQKTAMNGKPRPQGRGFLDVRVDVDAGAFVYGHWLIYALAPAIERCGEYQPHDDDDADEASP